MLKTNCSTHNALTIQFVEERPFSECLNKIMAGYFKSVINVSPILHFQPDGTFRRLSSQRVRDESMRIEVFPKQSEVS